MLKIYRSKKYKNYIIHPINGISFFLQDEDNTIMLQIGDCYSDWSISIIELLNNAEQFFDKNCKLVKEYKKKLEEEKNDG